MSWELPQDTDCSEKLDNFCNMRKIFFYLIEDLVSGELKDEAYWKPLESGVKTD